MQPTTTKYSRTTIVVGAILLVALALRVWGVWFGLPFLFHNDEGFEVIRALQLGTGEFDFGRITKGGYFFVLFVEYGILFATMLVSGVVHSATEFGELYLKDPTAFYLVGRVTTAIIGTITVYLVFRMGKLAYSATAGVIGGALLAVNVLHADLSHVITVDVPMSCLAFATLYFAVKIAQGASGREYWCAALLAALATTTKIPAGLLVISLLIAHYYNVRSAEDGRRFFANARLWQAAGIFLVVYLVLTPGVLLYGDDMIWHVLAKFGIGDGTSLTIESGGADEDFELDERAMYANINLFVFYLRVLFESMTIPVFVVCVAGLGYAIWRRRPEDVVLASFALILYVVISVTTDIKQFFPRYLLPAIPILALFGGRLLDVVLQKLAGARAVSAATAIVILLAVWPISDIVAANREMLREDTRAEGRHWVDEHIPDGSKIFIEGHRTLVSNGTIPLQNSAEKLRESIESYRGSEPGRVKYLQILLKVQTGATYDLLTVSPGELEDLRYYKDLGVQYFVLRPRSYAGSRSQFHWVELLDELHQDPDVELIQRFDPGPKSQPGPYMEIYRVNSNIGTDGSRPEPGPAGPGSQGEL